MGRKKPYLILCIAAALLLAGLAVENVYAYYFRKDVVVNELHRGTVVAAINETYNGYTKSNVVVTNAGNTAAYIRVRMVSYWGDENGNAKGKDSVYPALSLGSGWYDGGNYTYYYKYPLDPGDTAPALFTNSITLTQETVTFHNQDGSLDVQTYYQVVEFLAEAIQANPADAAEKAWGVTVAADGTIS